MNLIKIASLVFFFVTVSTYCSQEENFKKYSEDYRKLHWGRILDCLSKDESGIQLCHEVCAIVASNNLDTFINHQSFSSDIFTDNIFKLLYEIDFSSVKNQSNAKEHYEKLFNKVCVSIDFLILAAKQLKLNQLQEQQNPYKGLKILKAKFVTKAKRSQSLAFKHLKGENLKYVIRILHELFDIMVERYLEFNSVNDPLKNSDDDETLDA